MRPVILMILIVFMFQCQGQILSDSLLKQAYNETIKSYFKKDSTLGSHYKYKSFIIVCHFDTSKLIKKVTDRPILYVSDSLELTHKLKPKRKHYYRDIYTISHVYYNNSQDTIDINISRSIFLPKKGKVKFILPSHCGGVFNQKLWSRHVYIQTLPDGRLFNGKSNSWEFLTKDQMIQLYDLLIN